MNTAVVGLELAFDFPVKQKIVEHVVVVKTPSAPVEDSKPCPTPPVVAAPAPAKNLYATVFFQKNSSVLDATATAKLDSLVKRMQSSPYVAVVLQGRASAEGNKQLNLNLSKSRGESVSAYLESQGVSKNRLHSSGAGAVGAPNNEMNRNTIVIVLAQ
jgi:outer membrane protein OmpA-like peptidoglycan-associated protein